MRKRYQTGGVRKQRGRWIGFWRVQGCRKSRVLGFVKDMTKSEAREAVGKIVGAENAKKQRYRTWRFGEFVDEVFIPYYSRKWKKSTKGSTVNRIQLHLVGAFGGRELSLLLRDELQDLLDRKVRDGLSFSIVDHLRWDLRQIFEMAVAEGLIERNPAALLFTPREAQRPVHRLMTTQDVRRCIEVLDLRERIIVKLAVLAGMRPGEIFGLTWNRISTDHVEIVQRVYRGTVDTPKTNQSIRRAAIPVGLAADIAMWREFAADTKPQAFVFASERKTPLTKENVWRRNILPRLSKIGIEWVNFQVMRRTHASIMKELGVDPKWVADQLGHSLDVSQNVYTQVSVEQRLEAVQQLESALVM
jgi:integrase